MLQMSRGLKVVAFEIPPRVVLLAFLLSFTPAGLAAGKPEPLPQWAQPVVLYLESLSKPDGGYGWPDQPFGHISASWAVIGSYEIIGREPPKRERLIEFVRTHHPFKVPTQRSVAHAGELKSIVFQQIQSLRWLGAPTTGFDEEVSRWGEPSTYPRFYERTSNPVFQEDVAGLLSWQLLGLNARDVSLAMRNQLAKRMRPNGTFNNTVAADQSEGHLVNTMFGLLAMQYLGSAPGQQQALTTWLQDCQNDDGGFASTPAEAGSRSDLYFSWAAVRALEICGARPRDESRCVRFILRHWQDAGGFSWYQEAEADPLATYYALDALQRLGALDSLQNHLRQPRPSLGTLPENLRVVSLQLDAPGQGSPIELIRLARSLKIDHWVTRNGADGYRDELQKVAAEQGVPVIFDKAQEDYILHVNMPGLGDYARTSLLTTPDKQTELLRVIEDSMEWKQYLPWRRKELDAIGGLMAWNVCDNELYVRRTLDQSLESGGYDMINVQHFGGWDLLVNFPWLRNYAGRIPFVALSNAQGGQSWWWSDRLASFRTLYLAEEPSWVVAVRFDPALPEPLIYGGTRATRDFIIQHQDEWKWWGSEYSVPRPAVSLVAVRSGDQYESLNPERGVILRARTWWQTDAAGFQREKRSELISLSVDGRDVQPRFVEHRNMKNKLVDCYYRYDLLELMPGTHVATAEARVIQTGAIYSQSIEFEAA
jgi:hypothetical protein